MRERDPHIHVVVRQSAEAIDFDAWLDQYLRALIAADRAARAQQEAA